LSDHDSQTAFSGGGLIGFNHQFDHIVVGLEGDVVDGSDTLTTTACTVYGGCWTPDHDSFTTYNRLDKGVTGHVRVRLGYAAGRTLFYAAGGYSVADTRLKLTGDCYDANDPSTPTLYRFSPSKTVSGFNVGAGVEHAVTDHVMLRAEYPYDAFGTQLYKGDGSEWNDRRVSRDSSIFREAASYRF
jgi:outer membrane immunogenic protein